MGGKARWKAMADNDERYFQLMARLEAGDDPASFAHEVALLAQGEGETQRLAVLEAAIAERQGRPEDAMARLERFIASKSDNGVARANLARLQWTAGERVKAVGTLRFALVQAPNQERSLHLYAAWIEQQTGFESALRSLELMSGTAGAWRPAWVGAELASSRLPSRVAPLLLLAASHSKGPFPPSAERLWELLDAVPASEHHATCAALRSYCDSETQAHLDERMERPRPRPPIVSALKVTALQRSAWRHLVGADEDLLLGIAPICLIKPEAWGVGEVAGRLSRGLALLLAEALDALSGGPAAVLLQTVPEAGVVTRPTPQSGAELAAQNAGRCEKLISAYLSFREPGEFLLDVELYDGRGGYLNRASCRGSDPGACLDQLARQLASALPSNPSASPPPYPSLGVEEALVRETVASFVLCAEGTLKLSALGNPDRSLQALVEYALRAGTADALLCLWAAVEAGARAGVPGGEGQRAMIAEVMAAHPELAVYLNG